MSLAAQAFLQLCLAKRRRPTRHRFPGFIARHAFDQTGHIKAVRSGQPPQIGLAVAVAPFGPLLEIDRLAALARKQPQPLSMAFSCKRQRS